MINIDYSSPISTDDITCWNTSQGWVYVTLLGVHVPQHKTPSLALQHPLKEIVINNFGSSTQLAFLINKSVVGHDITNSESQANSVIFIQTSMTNSEVVSLKSHIAENGSSIFNPIKSGAFPKYNTNFKTAFEQARSELGPNSIFRFNGKLYTTNHPGESFSESQSALVPNPKKKLRTESLAEQFVEAPSKTESPDLTHSPSSPKVDLRSTRDIWGNPDELEAIESFDDEYISHHPSPCTNKCCRTQYKFEKLSDGKIFIDANMHGVPVYIDGKYIGNTPFKSAVPAKPGWHQVSSFTPEYKQMVEAGYYPYENNDPMVQNNQFFGAQTVFVESGKISNVKFKFNKMGFLPKKWKDLNGGWLIGLPMIMSFFFLITLGL